MPKKNTSHNLILASQDKELEQRVVAIAAEMGFEMPQSYVGNRMLQIASQAIDSKDTETIASVYEYANNVREEKLKEIPDKPGKNKAAVTDDHIRTALTKLKESENK